MKKQTPLFPNHKRVITITAFAAIIAGTVFVINYPKAALRYELDSQRMLETQDLEQALEWYMLRQAMEETNTDGPTNS